MNFNSVLKNKKVSILICFYERPSFLPLIVHNLKTQTFIEKYPNQIELVIADDSSANLCLDIDKLKYELQNTIKNITYIKLNEKLTIGQKRNLLCKQAQYSALIFMDDDDYYFPCYIEYSLFELYKRRKALVGSNAMLFCYVDHNFKKLSISCVSPRQIHEATMCMLKSHFDFTGGFNEYGNGEGSRLIDGHENKVNAKLDISKLMVCICHKKNTCNKEMFLKLGKNADYEFNEEIQALVKSCVDAPIYKTRIRFCFKYATRERPDQFKKTLELYMSMLSNKFDYHFVISMDNNDLSMNNDDIRNFLHKIRTRFSLEYAYGDSNNKIHAINRDMIAPSFHILVLISDDMRPVIQNFDDIIAAHFDVFFPDFDGMLNFNDGMRKDWPQLCTLTVYGYKYYQRFGYIYNPEYENVYCDNEQTEVGRLLGKIKDIDTVIIRHEWNSVEFQDELRKRTELEKNYKKDHETYLKRKERHFDLLQPKHEIEINYDNLLTIIVVCNNIDVLNQKIKFLESMNLHVNGHYSTDKHLFTFMYLHRLTYCIKTPYVTFCFPNEICLPEYKNEILSCLNTQKNVDVVLFNQECSLDNGKSVFTIESGIHNEQEEIPINGPWKLLYKRSISNWTIFKTSLWQTFIPTNEHDFMTDFISKVTTHYTLNKTLYNYTVGTVR